MIIKPNRLLLLFVFLFAVQFTTVHGQTKVEVSTEIVGVGGQSYFRHRVTKSQTLYALSKAYNVSIEDILQANPELRTTGLRVRTWILIPTATKQKSLPDKFTEKPLYKAKDTIVTQKHPLVEPKPVVVDTITATEPITSSMLLILPLEADNILRVAVLLPFGSADIKMVESAVDFYNGLLLSLGELDKLGMNIDVDVLSSAASAEKVKALIDSGKLDRANVVIGPVYEEPFDVVAAWAAKNRVVAISPLGPTGVVDNPYLIQVAPVAETKYDKLFGVLNDTQNNIVMLAPENYGEKETQTEFEKLLPSSALKLNYSRATSNYQIGALLDEQRDNYILVPTNHEGSIEEILSKISSLNSPIKKYNIKVVGTTRWRTLSNVTLESLFRNEVMFICPYYGERSDDAISTFFSQYLGAYGTLPSLFSMRGYDVMSIAAKAYKQWGQRMLKELDDATFCELQMPYKFKQSGSDSKFINTEWVLVQYTSDFRIELK
ncbi:MAG: LysM peptidoglycan-binding domain-containing protein [Mucinivorans sp.]